jgi:hypothetical protein
MALSTSFVPQSEPTISDVEQAVANGLEALRNAPLNEQITAALQFLTPPGYRPIAQLEEDGRKKRSNAAASNWNPETGEIVIYFERLSSEEHIPEPLARVPADASYDPKFTEDEICKLSLPMQRELLESNDSEYAGSCEYHYAGKPQIQQCCEALAEAEKAGKAFLSLKWFRDVYLVARSYPWAAIPSSRQAVLARAIEAGAISTGQIPNPKAPKHPTTTIKLNRESNYAQTVAPRYQPIPLRGDGPSASEILLRDRGRF